MRITTQKLFKKLKEWSSLRYVVRPLSFFNNNANLLDYLVIKRVRASQVKPITYFGESKTNTIEASLPEAYIATISNVSIIGSSNVLVTDSSLLYELLHLKDKRICISDIGLFRVWNKPVHFGKYYVCCYSTIGECIDEGIYMGGNFSGNYYHFLIEFMSKFHLLEQTDIPDTIPIILDKSAKQIPQFAEIVNLFTTRKLIYIDRLQKRKVKKLHYPSFVNIIPPNFSKIEYIKPEDCLFDIDAISFIRRQILKYIEGYECQDIHNFFISRKSSKWRKYNEEELMAVLSNKGYEVVYPERMSAREQFALFSRARSIVAASGAALTNIICCQPQTRVLVLMSTKVEATVFSTIAHLLDIDLKYITGEITSYNNIQSDFIIEPSKLRQYLDESRQQ